MYYKQWKKIRLIISFFSSCCKVYGQAEKMPINEATPLKKPQSPYGNTKKMGEEIIEDYVNATGKNAILLRYFNPVGCP